MPHIYGIAFVSQIILNVVSFHHNIAAFMHLVYLLITIVILNFYQRKFSEQGILILNYFFIMAVCMIGSKQNFNVRKS